jgi:hypothetical protein
MRQRRFEEILDECISAYLDGRRSVEQSLSLYPSVARRLEPLLRAAADTFDVFQELQPAAQAQERIRQRIVRAAAERAAAKALTSQISGFGIGSGRPLFGWAMVGSAVAGVAGLLIVGAAVLPGALSEDGGTGTTDRSAVSVNSSAGLDRSILNARQRLDAIQQKARTGRDIGLQDLGALTGATRTLAEATHPDTLEASDAVQLEEIIHEQLSFLERLGASSTQAEKEEIKTAMVLTLQLAESLGIDDEATATPEASDAASPTVSPTATPEETATATPEPGPSATPAP